MKSPLFVVLPMAGLAGLMVAGCASQKSDSALVPTQEAAATAETAAAENPISLWLAEAPAPAQVPCSVQPEVAPDAVERFNALSERIFTLYQSVYNDVKQVSENGAQKFDLAGAMTSATDAMAAGTGTEWRSAAQAAITAHYQATMRELEAQSKALTTYIDTLKSDTSISNMVNRVQQNVVCLKLGSDSAKLSKQLKDSGKGASLVLQRRIEATLEK